MHLQGTVTDAHFGDPAEGHAQSSQQLGTQLIVQPVTGVGIGNVAADVLVKQHGVTDAVGEQAEAADAHVHVQADVVVHHAEGHRAGGAVLVARQLLGVKIVDPLILGRLSAEGEAPSKLGEGLGNALPQVAAENGGLCGGIIGVFAGLGGKFHNPALIHNHHALTVGYQNHRTGSNDIIAAAIGAAAAAGLAPLQRQHPLGNCLTGKKLFPLIRQHPAGGIQTRTNQSHNHSPYCILMGFLLIPV